MLQSFRFLFWRVGRESVLYYIYRIFLKWIPNAITLLNLQCGLLGIIYCSEGLFYQVYLCSIFSSIFDLIDGKVARYLHVESKLGAELDSLADIVSFVAVPSLLCYSKYTYILPASIYLACGAYRLARFNVSHSSTEFEGISTPVSNVIILMASYFDFPYMYYLYIIMAFLMVSKIKIIKI